METLVFINQKGGVGKTTSVINIASLLAGKHDKKVLLLDCDGQSNLSSFFRYERDEISLYDVVVGDSDYLNAAVSLAIYEINPNLHIIPADDRLLSLDLSQISKNQGVAKMKEFLEHCREFSAYDYVIFDCPPLYTYASTLALIVSDSAIIPMRNDPFSLSGLEGVERQIRNLQNINPKLKIMGCLFTFYDKNNDCSLKRDLQNKNIPVFDTSIRNSRFIPLSLKKMCPVSEISARCAATVDYSELVLEIMNGRRI